MARLFVAARPPADVLEVVEGLPRPDEPGVRWVPPSQWHVTLRFLGEADEDEALAALATVPATLAGGHDRRAAIEAVLGPAVSRLGRSVVCIPVSGLDQLASVVGHVTASVGEPADPRPFTGHLTLARLRHRGSCRLAGTKVDAWFPVGEIELVRSTLASTGARHEVLAVIPLDPLGGPGSGEPS